MIAFPFSSDMVESGNHENRELTSFNEVINASWRNKPYYFREYFNDHLPLKNQIITLHSLVFMRLFNTTASPLVVVGSDGWLFFNNIGLDNPISDVTGVTSFSSEEMNRIASGINARTKSLSDAGIELRVLIIPNKEAVYSDFLPGYISSRRVQNSRTDVLADYLVRETDNVIYPKNELIKSKDDYRVYHKYDTHWNGIGGYIAAREVFLSLGIGLPEPGDCEIAQVKPSKDLAVMAGIEDFCNDDYEYEVLYNGENPEFTSEEIAPGILRHTGNAADKRTVVVIGDSYFAALRGYFCSQFCEVIEINRNTASYEPDKVIEKYQPSIVIRQVVERASSTLLQDDILS